MNERHEVIIDVLVQPRASRDEVIGPDAEGRLRVRLCAPPVEGRANKALVALLAEHFGVSKSDVTIVSGLSGRRKRIMIRR